MTTTRSKMDSLTLAGLNLIQQALSIYDSDLRLVVCNRPFKDMFSLPDALVTPGARFDDTIRHLASRGEYGDVGDIDEFVQDRVETARAFEQHYMERTRSNGRTISVEGTPLPQGGWVTVYTDITRTRRQEALLRARSEELSDQLLAHAEELGQTNRALESTITALEETKRELTEIEARTRLTAEMMPAHIAHVDRDRRYTFSNRRLSSVMPGRPSDIIGRHIGETLGAQAYGQIEPYLTRAFDGTPSVFEFYDDLSSRRIRTAFTPDPAEEGPKGVYILSMDVTEEAQARAALQQTRRRETAALLVNGMAHDFSNLLTIILGMQGKLARMPLPAEAENLVNATLSAAQRGASLLHRIGDVTGHRTVSPAPTDIGQFLQEIVTLATPSLPVGVHLVLRNQMDNTPVLLDRGMLQDSLLNLILNARDACGIEGEITITAQEVSSTWLEIVVTDTGPGFSEKALVHALDPFFTTKGSDGSGLGLAMVYDMTKLVGGEIKISNSYRGARVTVRLPLRPAKPLGQTGLVLLVEDDPEIRATVREMLGDLSFQVVEAETVTEAGALINSLPDIAIAISDLMLRGDATGLDLLPIAAKVNLPIVYMTSRPVGDQIHQQALQSAPVLSKPFDKAQLHALLQQTLESQ